MVSASSSAQPSVGARPATSRLKVNPQLGSPPTLEFRPLGELSVDESYQRSIETEPSGRLIRRIAQFWDWGLCQPLAVARRQDGTLMVVDGQHRLAAARMRGDIAHIPCVITAYANTGDEAAAFVALNQNRKPLQPLDLFKAALAAEDETAIAVQIILEGAGLKLAPHTNWQFWKPGMLANVNALQSIYRRHGGKVLAVTLKAIAIGFEGAQLRFAGTVFNGLAPLAAKYLCLREDPKALAERIGKLVSTRSQAQWVKLARDEYASSEAKWQSAIFTVFDREFHRFELNGAVDRPSDPKPVRAGAPKPPMTFDEQLEKVRNGANIAEVAPVRRPDPEGTLGGVGSAML